MLADSFGEQAAISVGWRQKTIRLLTILCLVVIFSTSIRADVLDGEEIDNWYYPDKQVFQITKVEIVDPDTPKDLRGIPLILKGRPIAFDRHYMTLPAVNTGGSMVIGSCFEKTGNLTTVYPIGPFMRGMGSELMIFSKDGNTLVFEYGQYFKVFAKKLNDINSARVKRERFEQIYERVIAKFRGVSSVKCQLPPKRKSKYSNKDLFLIAKKSGKQIVLKGADLHSKSLLPNGSASSPREIREKYPLTNLDGCQINRYLFRFAKMSKEYNSFYIIGGGVGKISNGRVCSKTIMNRKISTADIVNVLDLKRNLNGYPQFGEWLDDNAITVKFKGQVIKILDIHNKNTLQVELSE